MRIIKVFIGLVFLLLMALLPLSVSQCLGRCLGKYLYTYKSSRSYHVSKANIDLCFAHLSADERDGLLQQSLQHTGMTYAEMGMSWLWPTKLSLRKVISVKGEALLKSAADEGRGVIIIAPHIGNWEVLNLYASNRYQLTVLYKPPKLKFFDWLINKMRKRLGGDMAPANASGVRKLMKKLRDNQVIAILPDQEPNEGSGKFTDFFNRPAYTMTLLSQLAIKTQCKVLSGVALREPNGNGFVIEFSEVDADINSNDLQLSLKTLNQAIEKIAKKSPNQYQLEYKRFKLKPRGIEDIY
jgi:KDO2-lipid IV(A) lauroyltransferase